MQRQSRQNSASIVNRAQRFKVRQRYSDSSSKAIEHAIDDLVESEPKILRLETDNSRLLRKQVKLEGLVARLERELAVTEAARKEFSQQSHLLTNQLANEHARAEKFKSAYDALKAHPVLKVARGIKKPLGAGKSTTNKNLSSATEHAVTSTSPASVNTSRQSAASKVGIEVITPSSDQTSDWKQAVNEAFMAYRDQGDISKPAEALRSLAAIDGAPTSFGNMHELINGQARLLEALPSLPPKTGSAVYTPHPDRVMYCAHSTGEYNSNGYSTRTTGLTTAIADAGLELFIAARPGYPWDYKTNKKAPKKTRLIREFQGVKTHFNPGASIKDDPLDKFIQLAADIYVREAMMNRPAVIVSASNHMTALPALIAARRLGIPFIYEVRGLWEITAAAKSEEWANSERFELAKRLEALVANEADRAFAITEEVREELVRRGASRENIAILPNAANIFQYVPLPSERSTVVSAKKPGEYLLGYAGSLVDYEGLDLLVDAIHELPEELSHVGALIVGDGAVLPALKQQVAELGLQDRVRFTGRVPNEKINDYLAIFDAVVCPRKSNIVTELVSPLKPIEAMAAGRPVIGSNVSPIATLLGTDSSRGILFAADDVKDLSDKIGMLASAPKLGQDIGRRARKWTVENRTWPIVAQTFVEQVASVQKREITGKQLKNLRLALIADEFTTSTIKREVEVVLPTPENWKALLDESPVDALIVESAWSGNDGTWQRKVGYYDDDQCADLSALIAYCRERNIPTIFWNKEDPVHFNRFKKTSSLFDVVLTTDANCLPDYWESRGQNFRALGSLPFWAQAEIHNPLGSTREYSHSVAYGGSYYGDRYAERSHELRAILEGVKSHGLTIYDRQADNPESPYKFPAVLQDYVQGGLTYDQMVEAYKSHPVHVNVNSVNASPTMFSRRVFELAACGTPVISGKSFGVTWLFDGAVPVVRNKEEAELISSMWMNSEPDRVFDAWAALRVTFRKHLAHQRLALALRMGGVAVEILELPSVGISLDSVDLQVAKKLLAFTVRPSEVHVLDGGISADAEKLLTSSGIIVLPSPDKSSALVTASNFQEVLADSEVLEDMLVALLYGKSKSVQASECNLDLQAMPLWLKEEEDASLPSVAWRTQKVFEHGNLRLRRPMLTNNELESDAVSALASLNIASKNVLVVGHDLKFAGAIMQSIEAHDHQLLVDKWAGHGQHDEEQSLNLIEQADVVFCEWSLGNLVWYSKHLEPHQKLVARFHSQELFTEYPRKVNYGVVDKIIFVSELIRGMAIQKFGIPSEKTIVIPNAVDTAKLDLGKTADAQFVLGYVGMVPQMKRFDLVLDLLENLRSKDDRFTLRVKGKKPEDYPWMAAREDEMAFYEEQYSRIEKSDLLRGAVSFDPQGDDMDQWYRGIGIAVSTSDFESFHFTLADGAASRALPVGLSWPGSEWLYPAQWLHSDTVEAAEFVLRSLNDLEKLADTVEDARNFTRATYDSELVLSRIMKEIEAD